MIRAQKGKDKKAVPIITFVVYHGAEEWDSPTSVAELFSDFDLYMKCLKAPFLVNLGKENIKDLLTHEEVACVEVLLAAQARHDFKGNMKSIVEATKNKKNCCFSTGINYITNEQAGGNNAFSEEFAKFAGEEGENRIEMFQATIERRVKRETTAKVRKEEELKFRRALELKGLTPKEIEAILSLSKKKGN